MTIKKNTELIKYVEPVVKATVRQREGVDASKPAKVPKTNQLNVDLTPPPPPAKDAGKGKKGKGAAKGKGAGKRREP